MNRIVISNKFLIILLLFVLFSCIITCNSSYADTSLIDEFKSGSEFLDNANETSVTSKSDIIGTTFSDLGSLMLYAGIIALVAIALILGIRFITSTLAGEASKVAAAKKSLIIFVIGVAVLLMSSAIMTLVASIIDSIGIA